MMATAIDTSRFYNTPVLLVPDAVPAFSTLGAGAEVMASDWGRGSASVTPREMYTIERGVARIAIDGTLVHRLGGLRPRGGYVGYDQIDRIVADALANREVGALLLDIDSPGGEVAGCFALARGIRKASRTKPIVALVNERACSAAYAVAAACTLVMTPRTGQVGSIGVYTMLVDYTRALKMGGIAVDIIRAGERKARGGPYEVADAETITKTQDSLDKTWRLFAELVSEFRPISAQAVLALEGDTFTAREAFGLNLIDAVDSPDAIFNATARLAH
jgi:signal peptide peptidase SppA